MLLSPCSYLVRFSKSSTFFFAVRSLFCAREAGKTTTSYDEICDSFAQTDHSRFERAHTHTRVYHISGKQLAYLNNNFINFFFCLSSSKALFKIATTTCVRVCAEEREWTKISLLNGATVIFIFIFNCFEPNVTLN